MKMKQKPVLVDTAKGGTTPVKPKPTSKEGPMSYQQGFATTGSL